MYGLYQHQPFIFVRLNVVTKDFLIHMCMYIFFYKTDALSGKLPSCFGLLLTHACERLS